MTTGTQPERIQCGQRESDVMRLLDACSRHIQLGRGVRRHELAQNPLLMWNCQA